MIRATIRFFERRKKNSSGRNLSGVSLKLLVEEQSIFKKGWWEN